MTAPLATSPSRFCLGIDTGGTFTDAVVYDHVADRVTAAVKTPTTHENLFGCVVTAMTDALDCGGVPRADIGLVAVSTTLATNALVEGAGRPAGLVAIGFDPEALARVGLGTSAPGRGRAPAPPQHGVSALAPATGVDRLRVSLASTPVVTLEGGHSAHGHERSPLDVDQLLRWLDRIDGWVEAYAVTAQFSVRNGAHESAARDAIRAHTGKPVTCSHELSPRLGGPRRAVTTLLNAQLISLTARFAEAIRAAMTSLDLTARLMVVRGDGSLMGADSAAQRPIETVLSGPAASVMGARHLAASAADGQHSLDAGSLVVDIGGTTTDIAAIRNGAVVAAHDSTETATATVGGHATMVAALPMVTVGLGGDSEISVPPDGSAGEIAVGPRRVVPLCVAARAHPAVVLPMLQRQLNAERQLFEFGQVLLRTSATPTAQAPKGRAAAAHADGVGSIDPGREVAEAGSCTAGDSGTDNSRADNSRADAAAGCGASGADAAAADASGSVDSIDGEILRILDSAGGAIALADLKRSARWRSALSRLERRGQVRRAAFTPTDACVVTGLADAAVTGDAAAAQAGAELFSRRRDRYGVAIGADGIDLARRVMRTALRSVAEALLGAALGADGIAPGEIRRPLAQAALDRRVHSLQSGAERGCGGRAEGPLSEHVGDTHRDRVGDPLWGLLDACEQQAVALPATIASAAAAPDTAAPGAAASLPAAPVRPTRPPSKPTAESAETPAAAPLTRAEVAVAGPVVAIGAPSVTYAPFVAALLGTDAVVPAHAEVANAVGAAVARIHATRQITITAPRRGSYRAHWGDDPPLWHSLDEARAWATAQATQAVTAEAAAAGAADPQLHVDWNERTAETNGRELFVEATLRVTASARP